MPIALLLALLATPPAPSADPNGDLMPVIDSLDVVFVHKPDGNALMEYYPHDQLEKGQQGKAWVVCTATPEGRLVRCAVEAEYPQDAGFGPATAKVAEKYCRVSLTAKDGTPLGGRRVRVKLTWMIGS